MGNLNDAPFTPEAGFSFERVIAPLTRDEFFAKHYEREELVVQRDDPAHFSSLLSLDRIDEYITTSSPSSGQMMMVNALADITPADYTTADGMIDPVRMYQLFNEGATIVLPGLQRRVPELAALCRAVEKEFDAKFQTNIYLSPPNAQGFKTHYDTHDVLVLQVAGSKDWRSYDVPVELPLVGQKFNSEKYTPVAPAHEFRLNAGDLYYCPRGLVHDARSTDDISLHITFGVMAKTWTEVMVEAVGAACVSDPSFRENLPLGFATDPDFDRTEARAKFKTLLSAIGDHADFDTILDGIAAEFIAERRPLMRGQMHQMMNHDRIDETCSIMARPDLIYTLTQVGENVELRSGGNTVTFPAHVTQLLKDMVSLNQPTKLASLDADLDDAGRVVLAKRLMAEGLIVVHT